MLLTVVIANYDTVTVLQIRGRHMQVLPCFDCTLLLYDGIDGEISMKKESKTIDEELVCIDSLVQYLQRNIGLMEMQVERVEKGKDPPDFWVIIENVKYAVEVTSIVSGYGYQALCQGFEDEIQSEAKNRNVLKGNYALIIMGKPEIPKRMSKARKVLLDKAIAYICDTSSQPTAIRQKIVEESGRYIALEKLSDINSSVGLVGYIGTKWEKEAKEELYQLIQERVIQKIATLEKNVDSKFHNNLILLLYDAHGFCGKQSAREACQKVKGKEKFHSIFWADSFSNTPNTLYPDSPGRNGYFLFSINNDWMRA